MNYLIKAVIFVVFLGMVHFVIDHFIEILRSAIQSTTALPLLCQFGIIQGLTIFISILATGFAFKQILNFLK